MTDIAWTKYPPPTMAITLRNIRERAGKSIKDVASLCNVHVSMISQFELCYGVNQKLLEFYGELARGHPL